MKKPPGQEPSGVCETYEALGNGVTVEGLGTISDFPSYYGKRIRPGEAKCIQVLYFGRPRQNNSRPVLSLPLIIRTAFFRFFDKL